MQSLCHDALMTCMYDIIEDINCACMTCNDDAAVQNNGIIRIRIRISYFSWEKPLAQRRLFKAPRTIDHLQNDVTSHRRSHDLTSR